MSMDLERLEIQKDLYGNDYIAGSFTRLSDLVWESVYSLAMVKGYLDCGCGMCKDDQEFIYEVCREREIDPKFLDIFCENHSVSHLLYSVLSPIKDDMVFSPR